MPSRHPVHPDVQEGVDQNLGRHDVGAHALGDRRDPGATIEQFVRIGFAGHVEDRLARDEDVDQRGFGRGFVRGGGDGHGAWWLRGGSSEDESGSIPGDAEVHE